MVQRLADEFPERQTTPAVRGRALDHLEKQRLGEVVAATRRVERAAGREQSHGAEVDLVVAAEGARQGLSGFRECRRVEHDRVEYFALSLLLAQVVEGIGLDAL